MKKAFLPTLIIVFLALLVYALTNPGRSVILPAIARDVVVSGKYAYLAVEAQGLRILDISVPAHFAIRQHTR